MFLYLQDLRKASPMMARLVGKSESSDKTDATQSLNRYSQVRQNMLKLGTKVRLIVTHVDLEEVFPRLKSCRSTV